MEIFQYGGNQLMLKNEQKISGFLTRFRELTKEQQEQVYWFASHMDIFELMVRADYLTDEEADAWIQQAAKKKDYVLMSLIQYKQIKDQNRFEHTQ